MHPKECQYSAELWLWIAQYHFPPQKGLSCAPASPTPMVILCSTAEQQKRYTCFPQKNMPPLWIMTRVFFKSSAVHIQDFSLLFPLGLFQNFFPPFCQRIWIFYTSCSFFFHGIVGSFTIYTVLYDSQGEKILTASNITHSLWKTKVAISQHFYFQISYNSSKCFLWLLFNRTSSLIDWLIHSFKSNLKHLKHTKHSIMVLEYGEK